MCAAADGVLVTIVSGGRPAVAQRPTERLLGGLDAVTVVSSHEADGYEVGRAPLAVYGRDWAMAYARGHWAAMSPPGEVLGPFPGREWAGRLAAELGCWALVQLDDNIVNLSILRGTKGGIDAARQLGGLAFYVETLALIARSTNSMMVGAQLQATNSLDRPVVARTGFPYSLFLEKVEGRAEWWGPVEDDILQAFTYGTRAEFGTSAVVPVLRYRKEYLDQSGGLRRVYDSTRSVRLQQIHPESASLAWRKAKANGRGSGRVFHKMTSRAIRNPLIVTDPVLFAEARDRVAGAVELFDRLEREANLAKVRRRGQGGEGRP